MGDEQVVKYSWQYWNNFLGSKAKRPLENNTSIYRVINSKGDITFAVQLHKTFVVTNHKNGRTYFHTDGWYTVTTRARINDYMPSNINWCVLTEKGVWYWANTSNWIERKVFTDGDWIDAKGKLHAQARLKAEDKIKELKRKIASYADRISKVAPFVKGSGVQCLYCAKLAEDLPVYDSPDVPIAVDLDPPSPEQHQRELPVNMLTEFDKDTAHLLEHMKNGDVVHDLVRRAMVYKGCGSAYFDYAFPVTVEPWGEMMTGSAVKHIKKSVQKYLHRQLKLAN